MIFCKRYQYFHCKYLPIKENIESILYCTSNNRIRIYFRLDLNRNVKLKIHNNNN